MAFEFEDGKPDRFVFEDQQQVEPEPPMPQSSLPTKPPEQKMLPEGGATLANTLFDLGKNAVTGAIKETGFSLGISEDPSGAKSPGFMGGTRAAASGQAPDEVPRFQNPSDLGFDVGSLVAEKLGYPNAKNIKSGVYRDVSNLAPIAQAIVKGGTSLLRHAPGAAPVLNEEAISTARQLPGKVSGGAAQPLWEQFKQSGFPEAKMENVSNAIDDAVKQLSRSSNPDTKTIEYLQNIKANIAKTGGALPLDIIDADRKQLGTFVRQTERAMEAGRGGWLHKIADDIYAAYHRDLEAAGNIPNMAGETAQTYKAAIEASRKEFLRADLSDIIETSIKTQKNSLDEYIDVGGILDKLKNSRSGKKVLSGLESAERKDILDTLQAMKIPRLPPATGAKYGSGQFWKTSVIFGAIGKAFGLSIPEAGIMGAASAEIINDLLWTAPGRAFLRAASHEAAKIPMVPGKTLIGASAAKGAIEKKEEAPPSGNP